MMDLSDYDRRQLFSLLIQSLQSEISYFSWEQKEIHSSIVFLSIARHFVRNTEQIDLLYATAGVVVETLNATKEFELSRNLAEEVLLATLIDEVSPWGYLILFLGFTGQHNTNFSLIYLNLFLAKVIETNRISSLLLKRFVSWVLRFYRNLRFHPFVKYIYSTFHKAFTASDLLNISITYFSSSFQVEDPEVANEIYEYITLNREFVFREGKIAAFPLLNLIHQIKANLPHFSCVEKFDEYIPILELIVGKEDTEKLLAISYANSPLLKKIFIEAILTAAKSDSAENFINEIHDSMVLAEKLIILSFTTQDPTCFLLAMILRADFSLTLFREDSNENLKTVEVYEKYSDHVIQDIGLNDDEEFLWLGESAGHVYSLTCTADSFYPIKKIESWKMKTMHEWLDKDFIDLAFDSTIKLHGQVEQYTYEYQMTDLDKIKRFVSFSKTDVADRKNLTVIKDMSISRMPHNLILDQTNDFISRQKEITCIPSIEWLIINNKTFPGHLDNDFSISLWIPLEQGDFLLNLLWAKIEDIVENFKILTSTNDVPDNPLSSQVNIISAHGGKDIASFEALFLSDEAAITKVNRIIGDGLILILLVCHSGSMEKALFESQVLSLVHKYLNSGYQAVVAPFWSLHVDIPPVWLPVFLTALNDGDTVSAAVFRANNKVYENNINPGAWACMHLYGNSKLSKAH